VGTIGAASELAAPRFLQLAGHPLRWRLLRELARSDRQVHELISLLGQQQSLVSYHLGKLRAGKLVTARRSSADGRDAYYSVDLSRFADLLATTGTALHPGLQLGVPSRDLGTPPGDLGTPPGDLGTPPGDLGAPSGDAAGRQGQPMAKVLFLCTGNSARSQMAEALARERSGGWVAAFSAGSRPKPLHPDAVRVMAEHGIDLAGRQSKHLSVFADDRFDYVITLCDRVREVCPEFPGHPEHVHWSIPDPSAAASGDGDGDEAIYAAFRHTAAELETRVGFLLAAISAARPQSPVQERGQ
jgi:ArsR family transcriptional regulator, arsenate/arsenite/antimonite-responsive transcriptional repressor / arsenate reductase (thioredoxin)